MGDAAKFNLAAQSNEDFGPFAFELDEIGDNPMLLDGWSFAMNLVRVLTAPPDLAVRAEPTRLGSFIRPLEPTYGTFELLISRGDLAFLFGDSRIGVRLFYNILGITQDGLQRPIAKGVFTIEPPIGVFAPAVPGIFITADGTEFRTRDGSTLGF